MESRQNLDAEEDQTIDNSVQSVDDVIRAVTGTIRGRNNLGGHRTVGNSTW